MAMILKCRGRKPYFSSLGAVGWVPLCWMQSSTMFCFICRAIFQQNQSIFRYQESSHKNPGSGFFPKHEKIWHPLDLDSHVPAIIWTWVAAVFLRPGLPSPVCLYTHLQLSPQPQGQVWVAICHCYCTFVWIKAEKYFSVPMSLSTAGKQKPERATWFKKNESEYISL